MVLSLDNARLIFNALILIVTISKNIIKFIYGHTSIVYRKGPNHRHMYKKETVTGRLIGLMDKKNPPHYDMRSISEIHFRKILYFHHVFLEIVPENTVGCPISGINPLSKKDRINRLRSTIRRIRTAGNGDVQASRSIRCN